MTPPRQDWLTTDALARRWRVSPRTLQRGRAAAYGPAWLLIGGSVRYRLTDVLDWEAPRTTWP